MNTPAVVIETLPPFLSIERAAELAARSKPTIRRWAREGRLRSYRSVLAGSARRLVDTKSLLLLLGIEATP